MRLSLALIAEETASLHPIYQESKLDKPGIDGVRLWTEKEKQDDKSILYLIDAKYFQNRWIIGHNNKTNVDSNAVTPPLYLAICGKSGMKPVQIESILCNSNWIYYESNLELSEIWNRLLDVLLELNRWDAQMQKVLLEGGSLQDLNEIAASKLSNPLSIFDSAQTVLCHAGNFLENYEGTIWTQVLSKGFTPIDFYSPDELQQIQNQMKPGTPILLRPRRNPDHQYLTQGIFCNGQLLGTIGMVDINAPFVPGQLFLILHVVSVLELAFRMMLNSLNQENDIYYLLRLLDGQSTEEHILQFHLHRRNWKMRGNYHVLVFSYPESTDYSKTGLAMQKRIQDYFPKALLCHYEKSIVAILRKEDTSVDHAEEKERLQELCRENYLFCGISDCFSDFAQLKTYYIQAKIARDPIHRIEESTVAFFRDCYVSHLLQTLDNASHIRALCYPKLLELYTSNRHNKKELLDSLFAYLLESRNVAATARRLYLHRNTLLYRIHVLGELLELDLEQMDDALYLQLLVSCLIMRDGRYM